MFQDKRKLAIEVGYRVDSRTNQGRLRTVNGRIQFNDPELQKLWEAVEPERP